MFATGDNAFKENLWPPTCHDHWMRNNFQAGLVSVIIPSFNRCGLLIKAMDSVWAQTYRPIELIIIDDGSTDNTKIIVRNWKKNCEKQEGFYITYLHQENRGAPVARNLGLIESRGEYIQFLDSDDQLFPDKLADQVSFFRSNDIDLVYGITKLVGPNNKFLYFKACPMPQYDNEPYIAAHLWDTSSPLFSHKVCITIGPWHEGLNGCQEYEYAARVKAMGFRCAFIPKIVDCAVQQESMSISRSDYGGYAKAIEKAAELVIYLIDELNGNSPTEYNRVAQNLIKNALRFARMGDFRGSQRCLIRARSVASGGLRLAIGVISLLTAIAPPLLVLEMIRTVHHIFRSHDDG